MTRSQYIIRIIFMIVIAIIYLPLVVIFELVKKSK